MYNFYIRGVILKKIKPHQQNNKLPHTPDNELEIPLYYIAAISIINKIHY